MVRKLNDNENAELLQRLEILARHVAGPGAEYVFLCSTPGELQVGAYGTMPVEKIGNTVLRLMESEGLAPPGKNDNDNDNDKH